jgi:hypothetical protein
VSASLSALIEPSAPETSRGLAAEPDGGRRPTESARRGRSRGTRSRLAEVFTADVRSLAALRVVLALAVLLELKVGAGDLTAHFTDSGVLPRSDLAHSGLMGHSLFALNLISGGAFVQGLLFAMAALAAVGLLVGYCTRLMNLIVWLLVVSIQWRNPLLIGGGEVLLRLLLFWGLFLPLGAVWSVDRARKRDPQPVATRVASVPVAALFLQVAFVYWFAAILKSGPEWRFKGTALYDALSVDQLAKPLAHVLVPHAGLLTVMTFGVLAVEAFGPFLLLSPFFNARARIAGVFLFMSFHLGIWLTLGMGIFPAIAGGCMVCFLPGLFWDRIGARFGRRPTPSPAAGSPPRRTPLVLSVATGTLIAYVLFWNIGMVSAVRMPQPLERAGQMLSIGQKWDMFAPSPLKDDGWYVIPGTLRNGRTVDLAGVLRGDASPHAVSFRRPSDMRATFKDEPWRKYLENLRLRNRDQAPFLARYVCRQWNSHHPGDQAVDSLVVLFAVDLTLPDNRHVKPRLRTLGTAACA